MKLRQFTVQFVCAALVALAVTSTSSVAQAAIVNLNGITNSSSDGSNGVVVTFNPGTYVITPTIDVFTAFNRSSTVTGCNASGANCATGWD